MTRLSEVLFKPPPKSCVLYYPGLPQSGGVIRDRSPYGNDGTIMGATWTRLPSGLWVLDFDGTDDWVSVNDVDSLTFLSGAVDIPCTVKAWVKMTDATSFPIFQKGAWASTEEYEFTCDGNDRINWVLVDHSAADAYIGKLYGTALTSYENTWIQLIGTYSGNASTAGIKIYLNGVRVDNADITSGTYIATENLAGGLKIGRYEATYKAGSIALPAMFNKEWTASQVVNSYNQEKDLFKT